MDTEYTEQEITWRTLPTKWVDIDTGEIITEAEAKRAYVVIKTKTEKHVQRKTGTITHTKLCRTSRQGKLFE